MLPPSSPTSSGLWSRPASGTASSMEATGKHRRPAWTAVTAVVVARITSIPTTVQSSSPSLKLGKRAIATVRLALIDSFSPPSVGTELGKRVGMEPAAVDLHPEQLRQTH